MFLKIGYTGSKQYEAKYLHFEKKFNDVDRMLETYEKDRTKQNIYPLFHGRKHTEKTRFDEIFTI